MGYKLLLSVCPVLFGQPVLEMMESNGVQKNFFMVFNISKLLFIEIWNPKIKK